MRTDSRRRAGSAAVAITARRRREWRASAVYGARIDLGSVDGRGDSGALETFVEKVKAMMDRDGMDGGGRWR